MLLSALEVEANAGDAETSKAKDNAEQVIIFLNLI